MGLIMGENGLLGSLSTLWMFLYGGAFIGIVLFLPKGLSGIYQDHIRKWFIKESAGDNTNTN